MKKIVGMACVFSGITVFSVVPTAAQTLGMIMDNASRRAVVFNADTDTVTGSVLLGGTAAIGDCSIDSTRRLGFATDRLRHVWAIDLSSANFASGTSEIPTPDTNGEDISISPDGQHLLVCAGDSPAPVSVIDIATRSALSPSFSTGSHCNSVEVANNGSVLVTSSDANNVRRLAMSPTGTLSDTFEVMSPVDLLGLPELPANTVAAPGGASGVVITRTASGSGEVMSFAMPGLTPVHSRQLPGPGVSGVISPAGNRLFVRDQGGVSAFDYNSATGEIGVTPLFTTLDSVNQLFFGVDQMAIHPNGDKLYVSRPHGVDVYTASTGILLRSITDAAILEPTGVCLPGGPSGSAGPSGPGGTPTCLAPSGIDRAFADKTALWPPNHKMVDVMIDYNMTSSCAGTCTLSVTSSDPQNGTGDGNTGSDWMVVDAHHVQLRAEHVGRIYTITITCTNAGGSTIKTLTVTVRG